MPTGQRMPWSDRRREGLGEDQLAEQHPPVVAESHEETRPIQRRPCLPDQMEDIRAVIPLAFLDERFRPNHLFGRTKPYCHAEDLMFDGPVEPAIVDARHPIP